MNFSYIKRSGNRFQKKLKVYLIEFRFDFALEDLHKNQGFVSKSYHQCWMFIPSPLSALSLNFLFLNSIPSPSTSMRTMTRRNFVYVSKNLLTLKIDVTQLTKLSITWLHKVQVQQNGSQLWWLSVWQRYVNSLSTLNRICKKTNAEISFFFFPIINLALRRKRK